MSEKEPLTMETMTPLIAASTLAMVEPWADGKEEKTGMSYGQYMVLHPHATQEDVERAFAICKGREKNGPVEIRRCPECGAVLDSPKKVYCCEVCRLKASKKRRQIRARIRYPGETVACKLCGKEFFRTDPKRKYCSPECSDRAMYESAQRSRARKKAQKEAQANA